MAVGTNVPSALAFIKARWPLGLRVSQAMLIERSHPFGMVEDIRRHHQLVGAGPADEIIEAAPGRVRPADDEARFLFSSYSSRRQQDRPAEPDTAAGREF